MRQAKDKEREYIKRCESYLSTNKKLVDKSTKDMLFKRDHNLVSAALAGTASSAVEKARQQAEREERRCSLLRERDDKQLYLDRFE